MARAQAGDAEILREARERFQRCEAWEATARANALNDARFANADSYNRDQWDEGVRASRGDRPMLTFNKVRQHILQIVNDARQHKAQIKVTPTSQHGSYDAAEIFSGIIRRIEYQSKAVDAYSTAIYHQVETGIGYVRVVTDFASDDSFDQEIYIRRVADPRTIYLDPDAKDFDKADMRFAFVFDDVPRDQWEAEHGEGDMPVAATLDNGGGWNDKDHVRRAEYWRRNEQRDTLHLLSDGGQLRESELTPAQLRQIHPYITKSRDLLRHDVEWFKIVGDRIDSRGVWPGKYIPIVPFVGEEVITNNKLDRKGHTRALIDAQRMYNYWSSAAVEQVALQGKSPYIMPGRAVEGYETYWNAANERNFAYLPYNDTDDTGQPIARPERAQPPVMAQAYIQGMSLARDDMMMVSGQYQAEMGAPGNERSGVAIQQRQRQGDNATYHYIDNQAKGIRQVGRICLDIIPHIYDTVRVLKVMGADGEQSDVALVPHAPTAHQHVALGPQGPVPVSPEQADAIRADPNAPDPRVIFNPTVGEYDVEADVGPAFGTQRQEAANAFSQIMQQNPAAFAVVGDFWARNSDFPGADELAERLKRGLPAQYRPGQDPQIQAAQQQAQQQAAQFHQMMQGAQQQVIELKQQLRDKGDKLLVDDYDAETRRLAAVGAIDPASLQIIVRQMVEDMLGTQLAPMLQRHAAMEAQLQAPAHPAAPRPAPEPEPAGVGA